MNILSDNPSIYTVDNFLSEEECNHFINLSEGKYKQSLVSNNKEGFVSKGRSGKNTWIPHNTTEITKKIGLRIAKQVNMELTNAENFQSIYYDKTQEYKSHYDSWVHDNSEKTLRCMKYGGARLLTALVYLNDVEEGGGTEFKKLNLIISPKKGRIVVFENVKKGTNERHELSEHAGLPVTKGEKFAFNLWFREYNSKKLYSEFNPDYYKSIKN